MSSSPKAHLITLIIALNVVFTTHAAGQDIYVAYSGKDKNLKNDFMSAMADGLRVRTYNVDLLGIADYSGVQKAAAKLSKATVVILLKDSPSDMFKGSTIDARIIIVNSLKSTVKSSQGTLYVLGATTDASRIKQGMNRIDISSKSDLQETSSKLKSGDVIVVDESRISTSEAVAIIAENQARNSYSKRSHGSKENVAAHMGKVLRRAKSEDTTSIQLSRVDTGITICE